MEKEEVQVKDVGEINPDIVTPEQKEAAVINEAVDKGEVAEEYKVKEEDGVYKINLDNPPNQPKEVKSKEKSKPSKDAVQKSSSDDSDVHVKEPQNTESVQGVDKSVRSAEEKETVENKEKLLEKTEDSTSDSPLELITDDEKPTDKVEKVAEVETPAEETPTNIQEEPKQLLPENVDKLVKFMEETGGSVEDYVNLNKDLSKMDNTTLLREYYKTTKPHLDVDDVDFLFTKNFAYDEEADDPSEVKAKKLAFKEELYNAQNYFKGAKDKYYADLKLSKQNDIAPEYLEAMEHYKVSQQQTEEHKNLQKTFVDKTNKVFNDEFKGFDFKVGENKYRFNQFWDITKDRGEFPVGAGYPPTAPVIPGSTVLNGNYNEGHIWLTKPNGYVRELNATNIDYQKPREQRKRFRHYANFISLKRNISGPVNMIVKMVNTKSQLSQR